MGLSLVRIKGLCCKQSVNGKHIFVHCSITVNLVLPVLHSSTQSSANKRIKSMWLEAKYEWCNKMLVSIWWSEDGGGLGKETVKSSALNARLATCHHFWLPYLCFVWFYFSHVCSAPSFLSGCEAFRVEERGRRPSALLWLELWLLPLWLCHTQCLCPCMHNCPEPAGLWSWFQYELSVLNEKSSDFRVVMLTAALMLWKLCFGF